MTNKYKNKIKSMKFLNQSRTRPTPTAREMRESYREKEADEKSKPLEAPEPIKSEPF